MIYAGLLLFFVLEYIRPADSLMPWMAPLKLNTLVPIGIVLATLATRRRIPAHSVWSEANTRMFLAFLGLVAVSTVTARISENATFVFTTVVGYVLIYWVIVRQATDWGRLKGLFAILVFVHVTLAALTPQMFTDGDARHYLASGTFLGDGNDFALSVNVVIPLCLFLWLDARNKVAKVFFASGVLFLILCVVATRSRGGTIALASVGFYYWLKASHKVKTGLFGVLVLAAILVVAPPSYFERMDNLTNTEEGSAQGRIKAWNAGVWMAIANPLTGVGAGNFAANWGKTAHSIYFLVLGELGLPGIALLVLILFVNFGANRRLSSEIRKRDPVAGERSIRLLACMSAALIAFATGGAFLSALYYPHLYVLCGFLAAARRLAREDRQGAAEPAGKPEPVTAVARWTYLTARRSRIA